MKIRYQNYNYAFLFVIVLLSSCKKEFNQQQVLNASPSAELATGGRAKPNIILIIGDDVGREIPTYNGGQSYSTPNLDFMAANGMQFPYFFSHPDGPPSRLALVTGRYNYRNWVEFGELPATEQTFANLLHNSGYATCFTGKWQFDGGDSNIVQHGFDKYRVFMPFEPANNNGHDQFYHRYKNPYLYENKRYLTDTEVAGKYSEDMFFDYASNFIDSNLSKPFLLVYSHSLVQKPWVPTPDNPDFASWNPDVDDNTRVNRSYFPGMVAYMDKIIGKLINKVQTTGLANNTLIMFISDNATNKSISSQYKGRTVFGSKDSTTFNALNVPFLIYGPNRVAPGTVDTSLVDMTDFFPSFADIAKIKDVTAYQPLDGTSFYDNMQGNPVVSKQRGHVYWYWPRFYQREPDLSYVFDYNYKLYDSTHGGQFYNWPVDIYEKNPLPNNQLTSDQKKKKNQFAKILTSVPHL